ncbi:hypothetical protein ACFX5Q_30505 [Mesorhizobium sp. IMUNJ 23033]|uniref:hypothetical protein n=1 Tax=Mesorhizobium sp. IMUNJ 23033 TaxID=3378039 RepID=UPI00384F4CFF
MATTVCQESPAQISKELQAEEQARLPNRPKHGPKPKVRFSDYQLGKIIKKRRIVLIL